MMLKQVCRRTVLAISMCMCSAFAALSAGGSGLYVSPQKEIVLSVHQKLNGDFLIYLSQQGAKIVSIANGSAALARAPEWTVVCFRPKEKIQWSSPLKQYSVRALLPVAGVESKILTRLTIPSTAKQEKNCGLDCTVFTAVHGELRKTFWVAESNLPPECTELLCRYFDLWTVGKIPIRIESHHSKKNDQRSGQQSLATKDENNSALWRLDRDTERYLEPMETNVYETVKVVERDYDDKDFAYPKAFEKKNSLGEVGYPGSNGELVDMINDIYFTPNAKEKHK